MTTANTDEPVHRPVFEAFDQQPWSQFGKSRNFKAAGRPAPSKGTSVAMSVFLRDQFTISTWLLMGATAQCGLVGIFGARLWIVRLPVVVLGLRLLKTLLQTAGLLRNPYMDGVIRGRTTCHFPGKDGSYTGPSSNRSMAVLLISVRSNHPMGVLAPGMKELGAFFSGCVEWLEEDADARGLLGMTSWLNCAERAASNELLSIGYFRSVEDIHALAHHAIHRVGWKWWNESKSKLDHLCLTHEIFAVEAGSWENVFVNASPTHLGTTVVKGEDGRWRSPLIYTSAAHRSSANRMRRTQTQAEQQRQQESDAITGEEY
ncbi:conserved hypothetical protein [Sporisorium reilianum SRZ2]|uniref:Uncharacterized protein n=1 Tax=Sporisorium reilianum (strain SRZ2) TaxID=999809 RepID=E7A153_SPORE|nr:conserved hypothetical protein [Sporisorium reilianum SRZ2]